MFIDTPDKNEPCRDIKIYRITIVLKVTKRCIPMMPIRLFLIRNPINVRFNV